MCVFFNLLSSLVTKDLILIHDTKFSRRDTLNDYNYIKYFTVEDNIITTFTAITSEHCNNFLTQ